MPRAPLFGLSIAAFGAVVLSPDTLFMRWSGMDGFAMLGWRGVLMGSVLLAIWAATSRARGADLRAFATWPALAVAAFHFGNATCFSLAVAAAPVAVVLLAVATVPVFAAVFSRLLLGEPTSRATWITIVLVLGGIGFAVTGGRAATLALDLAALRGAVLGLVVAMLLALTFVVLRRSAHVPILLAIGSGAGLAGLSGVALTGPAQMMQGQVWAIAVAGAVILPVSFFALSVAARHTHAANVSLLLLLETVLGPVWVWAGTGEAPTPQMLAGGAVVVGSLAAYLWHGDRRRRAAAREVA